MVVAVAVFAALVAAFWFWWPLGVVMGVVVGGTATLLAARAMYRSDVQTEKVEFAALLDER